MSRDVGRRGLGGRGTIAAMILALALPAGAGTTAELLRCEKGIHTRGASFAKAVRTVLLACALKVETCKLAQEIDGDDATACLAAASAACGAYSTKVLAYKTGYRGKALLPCAGFPLADLEPFLAGLGFAEVSAGCGASTVSDLLACIFDDTQCAAERTVFTLDPRAADSFATAGIAAAHPCAAP